MLSKTYIRIILCCSFCLVIGNVLSQSKSPTIRILLDQTSVRTLGNLQDNTTNNSLINTSRAVQIQQVGRNNNINLNTTALINTTRVAQFGEKNNVFQNLISGSINNTILQKGIENSVLHYNTIPNRAQKATVVQYGLRQNLIWVGDNKLSQNMVVRMRGKKQTVLVRNRN